MVGVDELQDRYARLVAAFGAAAQGARDLDRLASDAELLASQADTTWLRVHARALAAAARAAAGDEPDIEAMVDASPPPLDDSALSRLDELLDGAGARSERLAIHDAGATIPPQALEPAAVDLLRIFHRRATEDLDLPVGHELALAVIGGPGDGWRSKLGSGTLTLNGGARWTVDRLVHVVSSQAYPGRHLAGLMRPSGPEWSPSPRTTVDCGLAAIGREVLLADHELAHELDRIGRRAGLNWSGRRIVAVRRARDDLAPAYVAAALASPSRNVQGELAALGADAARTDALLTRWRDPLARAHCLARAAGPPLVRAWLVTTGQTIGLQRLLGERLAPTTLRAEAGR